VNAYEVRAGTVFFEVKLCDPCLSALKWFVYHAKRYTSALLFKLFLAPGAVYSRVKPGKVHVALSDCVRTTQQSSIHNWTIHTVINVTSSSSMAEKPREACVVFN